MTSFPPASRIQATSATSRRFSAAARFVAAMLLVATAACDHKSSTAPATNVVNSITLTPTSALLTTGDTLRVGATVYDKAGNIITKDTVSWSSSNTAVATVSDSGTITAVSVGTAVITATDKAITATVAISVALPPTKPFTSLAQLATGFAHTCALTADGTAWCWGSNALGQLGTDSTTATAFPVHVSGGLSFAAISAGYAHTCGLTAGGAAWCWGDISSAQLGATITSATSSAPVAVSGGLHFTSISAGFGHTCGLAAGGSAWCWGANQSGQLGSGTIGGSSAAPVQVSGELHFASISAGGTYTCGVTTDGTGYCWGSGAYGVLGNGGTMDSGVPVAVAGGLKFASISAGAYHTCGLTTNGTAWCWGDGTNGQLGTGFTQQDSDTPVAVIGGHNFTAIVAANLNTCALTASGAAWCWGDGTFGALGTGSSSASPVPVQVTGGQAFAALSADGAFHTCGLTPAGTGYCWGYDGSGELGTGRTADNSAAPVEVVQHVP
jgi:alpha-tubulin suppressor-like RCC1 family protein